MRLHNVRQCFIIWLAVVSMFLARCAQETSPFSTGDLDRLISRQRLSETLHVLAGQPHPAGSPGNTAIGDYIVQRLKNAGWQTETQHFQASLQRPISTELILQTADGEWELPVREVALPEDPYSRKGAEHIPYFAYAPDFSLTAPVIYANYGARSDYELLRKHGIDPAGKIALVRAQGICRSMKAVIAKEREVAGLLLFPELRDHGFRKVPFPHGSHINEHTIQRGSVLKYFHFPGDPDRSPVAQTVPDVPALPISQKAALKILQAMGGPSVPEDWHGWLPASYRFGDGSAQVGMRFKSTAKITSLRNIVATLRARDSSALNVMAGTHYDAWVYGATDPASGGAVVLEAAETMGNFYKNGWRPERNIVLGFFDGEEFGMLGSTEWARSHSVSAARTGAYINVDSAVRARDFAGYVVPGLGAALDRALRQVNDPATGQVLFDVRGEFQLPGYSSDTIPFVGLLGIPSAEIRFGRAYSLYHSAYDDLEWYVRFADPKFEYADALTRILVLFLYELSGRSVLPYRFTEITDGAARWLKENRRVLSLGRFPTVAERVDQLLSNRNGDIPNARKIDQIYAKAMRALLVRTTGCDRSIPDNSVIIGPSMDGGCQATFFPSLQKPDGTARSLSEISAAFEKARILLEQAETLLSKR